MKKVTTYHSTPSTLTPELIEDMRWFKQNPEAKDRSREPSTAEYRQWGEGITEIFVLKLSDGGIARIPLTYEKTS